MRHCSQNKSSATGCAPNELKPLNLTKDSSWISIRPRDLPARPVRTYVSLKGDRGFIDLTLTGASFGSFYKGATPLLRADMSAHATGKSSAIRIEVEGFRPSEDLSSALPRVRRAFAACADLIAFIVSTGNDLTEWHLKRCHSRIRPEN